MLISEESWGWLSLAIIFVSYTIYLSSVFAGKTKPHAFSWFVWGPQTLITFCAQDLNGAGPGAWVTGMSGVLSTLIGIIALFYGERDITRSDWISFAGAMAVLPVWYFTQNAFIAVLLIIFIDGLGFFPTFRKSLRKPDEEPLLTYFLSSLQFLAALFAMRRVSWTTALYPAMLMVMNGAFVLMVLRSRRLAAARG